MTDNEFKEKVKHLIDDLKAISANYGLGNDGNEFKIITQVFLYKFMNDKFAYDIKKENEDIANADSWEDELRKLNDDDYEFLTMTMGGDTAILKGV